MIDQNLKIKAGDLPKGLYRIKADSPVIKKAGLFGKQYQLKGTEIEKLTEERAKEIAQSLGIAVLFGGIFGIAHALRKTVAVQLVLSDGNRIYGETSSKGFELLTIHSRAMTTNDGKKKKNKLLAFGLIFILFLMVMSQLCGESPKNDSGTQSIVTTPNVGKTVDKFGTPDFKIVKEWTKGDLGVNDRPTTSSGKTIIVKKDFSKLELTDLVKQLSRDEDPFVIQAYRTKKALNADENGRHKSKAVKKGALFTFSKINGQGTITWRGPFSSEGQTQL